MKVGLVCAQFPAISETFVLKHAKALKADVFAEQVDMEEAQNAHREGHVYQIGPIIVNPLGMVRRYIVYASRAVFGSPGLHYPESTDRQLALSLQNAGTEVVLGEFGHFALAILPTIKRLGLPLVPHFHGYDMSVLYRRRFYRKRLPALFDYASQVVVVNSLQRERVLSFGCRPSKIHVIPCGAAIGPVSLEPKEEEQSPRFLAVGRLVEVKGPMFVLRAFALVRRAVPGAKLTMIGGGPLESKCRQFVERAGLTNDVDLRGSQSHANVLESIRAADIFVQHSITTREGASEGWPVALAEAAAGSLPIVATRSGGIPENVMDGITGYLVAERDWKDMARRMIHLASDPDLRKKMGAAGRRHVEENGNVDKQVDKLKLVLEAAVAEQASRN